MSQYADIIIDVRVTTERAIMVFDGDEGTDQIWIPRSLIEGGEDIEIGDGQELLVQEWFAEQEGLI